jgi:Dockerin type I domain
MFFEVDSISHPGYGPVSKSPKYRGLKQYALRSLVLIMVVVFGYLLYGYVEMARGDINRDGVIDGRDSLVISSHNKSAAADLNGDGQVNADDLKILADSWTDRTILEKEIPKANITSPPKVIAKPIIYLQ